MRAVWMMLLCCCCSTQRAPATCSTRCGLKALPGQCEELQVFEDRAVLGYSNNVPEWGGRAKVCEALRGWVIEVHVRDPVDGIRCEPYTGELAWWDFGLRACLAGYTHRETHSVEVGDLSTTHGALPHELVHAIDFSQGLPVGHCHWKERGILKALKEITGADDHSLGVKEGCSE